jgi:hypothetical protein
MLDPSIVKYVFIAHRYERGLNRVLVSLRVYTSLAELWILEYPNSTNVIISNHILRRYSRKFSNNRKAVTTTAKTCSLSSAHRDELIGPAVWHQTP